MRIQGLKAHHLFIFGLCLLLMMSSFAARILAQDTPDIFPDQPFSGKVAAGAAVHHYFQGSAYQYYQIVIQSTFWMGSALEMTTGYQSLPDNLQETPQQGGTVGFSGQLPADDLYEISLHNLGQTDGDYTISLNLTDVEPPPLPSFVTPTEMVVSPLYNAQNISYGQTLTDTMTDVNGRFWQFIANDGDVMNLTVIPQPNLQGATIGLFVKISRVMPEDNSLFEIASAGNYKQVNMPGITLASGGQYMIAVTPLVAEFDPFQYTITLTKGAAESDTPLFNPLPNNLPAITADNVTGLQQIAQIGLARGDVHLAWSHDGKTVAMGAASDVALYKDSQISGVPVYLHADAFNETLGSIAALAFSPDDSQLLAVIVGQNYGDDNGIEVWDVATGEKVFSFKAKPSTQSTGIGGALFGANIIVVVNSDSIAYVWDVHSQKLLYTIDPIKTAQGEYGVSAFALSPDGSQLALAHNVNGQGTPNVSIYNTATGELALQLDIPPYSIGIEFSPDGQSLFIRDEGDRLQWMPLVAGSQPSIVESASDLRVFLNYPIPDSLSGNKLVTGAEGDNGYEILVLNTDTREIEQQIAVPGDIVAINAAQMRVMTAYNEAQNVLNLYDLNQNIVLETMRWAYPSKLLAYSADSSRFAFGGEGGSDIWVVDALTGKAKHFQHPGKWGFTLSADGKLLAVAAQDSQTLTLQDIDSGAILWQQPFEVLPFPFAIFSPDGKKVAAYSPNFSREGVHIDGIHWFDVETGQPTSPEEITVPNPEHVVSPDGSISIEPGSVIKNGAGSTLMTLRYPSNTFLFSPDGKLLLEYDGAIRIWAVTGVVSVNPTSAATPIAEAPTLTPTVEASATLTPTEEASATPAPIQPTPSATSNSTMNPLMLIYDPSRDLFLLDPITGARFNLTNKPAFYFGATWSPDGKRIAFRSDRDNPKIKSGEIFVINADGTGLINLSRLIPEQEFEEYENGGGPVWSPDGKYIAFGSDRLKYGAWSGPDIYVAASDGSSVTNLTLDSRFWDYDPHWSPDGRTIAYFTSFTIFLMNPDGSNRRALDTGDAADDKAFLSWSPDGTKLLYMSYTNGAIGGNVLIRMVDLASGQVTNVTPARGDYYYPIWSPDGSKVAFVTPEDPTRRDNSKFVIVDVATLTSTELVVPGDKPYFFDSILWTPDGQSLLYIVRPNGKSGSTYQINIDGSGSHLLFEGGFAEWQPVTGAVNVPLAPPAAQTAAPSDTEASPLTTVMPSISPTVMVPTVVTSPAASADTAATATPTVAPTETSPTSLPPTAVAAVPTPTSAPSAPPSLAVGVIAEVNVTDDGLELRASAGTNYQIMEKLPSGTRVTLIGGPKQGGQDVWWQVIAPSGNIGWVIEAADGLQTLIPVEQPTTCPGLLPSRMIVGQQGIVLPGDPNVLNSLPLRAATDSRSKRLGSMKAGSRFDVLAGPVCGDYAWWFVRFNGKTGWTAEGDQSGYWLAPLQ